MNEQNDLFRQIAHKLYELFIVNRNAMAIQLNDGRYVTRYVKFSENDIYCMLSEGKAIGGYQQLYKSPYLKWICFDFDCKDKDKPNIQKLYNECTRPLNVFLDKKGIHYINEFSGRRGIHTWIIFDNYVEKKDAYNIVQTIKKNVNWKYDEKEYGLDEFPSTPSSKGNVVGKQVKVPLSKHQKGAYSYFFSGNFSQEVIGDSFFNHQLELLKNIKLNNFEVIARKLNISANKNQLPFVRSLFIGEINFNVEDIIRILSKTKVYKAILDRVMHGEAYHKDWLVILGTLGKIDNGYSLVKDVFKYCPSFSEYETDENIAKYGRRYFPATFDYLYNLYDLDMEAGVNPSETGLHYIVRELGIKEGITKWNDSEVLLLSDSAFTVEKERKYLFSNDEVPVVSIWNDLNHMTTYDTNMINRVVDDIKSGENINILPSKYFTFVRQESEVKKRTLISLSAYDRVLTSHIALNVAYRLNNSLKSYSYNPNYISSDELFFHWFSSWGNYLSQIRKYIEVDLYSSMHVITIDIKHFYDSIDFLGVYSFVEDKLSKEENNLFMELIRYNEKLMRKICGKRIGVPQGPAYARIIAEIFLGIIIENVLSNFRDKKKDIFLYRYVDDIIIFHNPIIDSREIYDKFNRTFKRHGLEINENKSKLFGAIGKLTEEQKSELLRSNQFQYGLRVSEYSFLTESQYINEKVDMLIQKKGGFNISDISLFFSKNNDERVKRFYFFRYAEKILKSDKGRGSGYNLFYRFIFDNQDILEYCIVNSFFDLIPYNTINFSCLLSVAFYSFCSDNMLPTSQKAVIEKFIKQIKLDEIEEGEDKSIIISLSEKYI